MTANELRIGNLVVHNSVAISDAIKYPSVITGVLKETVIIDGDDVNISDISPIPLTADWLRRFGFEKCNDEYGGYTAPPFGSNKTCLRWVFEEHFESGFREQYWSHPLGERYVRHIRTDYVHQLQNVFWCLSGTELKLKE